MRAASRPRTARARASSTSAAVIMREPMRVEIAVPPTTTSVNAAVIFARSDTGHDSHWRSHFRNREVTSLDPHRVNRTAHARIIRPRDDFESAPENGVGGVSGVADGGADLLLEVRAVLGRWRDHVGRDDAACRVDLVFVKQ